MGQAAATVALATCSMIAIATVNVSKAVVTWSSKLRRRSFLESKTWKWRSLDAAAPEKVIKAKECLK